jgi:hypothetical protein
MILELRRSAFDTDLLVSGQSCQDLTSSKTSSVSINEITTTSTINPRRLEALQRDYERLGFEVKIILKIILMINHFQDLREPINDFQIIPPGILSLQNLLYFCIHQKNDFIRVCRNQFVFFNSLF